MAAAFNSLIYPPFPFISPSPSPSPHLHLTTNMSPPPREINCIRPTPLRIQKNSHIIQKPSSSSTLQHKPVIIYLHSPKIIHARACDFMALVQKLTGKHNNGHAASRPEAGADDILNVNRDIHVSCSSLSPVSLPPLSFEDVPLFTPTNFSEFFCSPMSFSISPSFMEAVKTIPDF